mmetsp:Transcript_10595/g.65311  ORF Transcript_10595/g.65311 Transcript_10595/m.65311 type:complete len:336 (-) Transcript_10595:820-1827(-)
MVRPHDVYRCVRLRLAWNSACSAISCTPSLSFHLRFFSLVWSDEWFQNFCFFSPRILGIFFSPSPSTTNENEGKGWAFSTRVAGNEPRSPKRREDPRSNDVDSTLHSKWTRASKKTLQMVATMAVAMQNVGTKTSWKRSNPTMRPSRRNVRTRAAVESYHAAIPLFEIAKQRGTLADGIQSALQPAADTFNTLGLPDWLVHWGHPGNMAIVLLAIGGYGSYLGWQLRNPEADQEVLELAAEKHPQLMGLMFFFFAVGASGGLLAEIMGGKPVLTSAHATTAFLGLALLGFQAMLPLLFEDQPNLRTAHAYLGSGIMLVFLVHAGLGLQHGLAIWA